MAEEINNTELTGQDQKPAVSPAARQEELPNPNAGVAHTPEISQDNAPSTSEPTATSIPSANKPDDQPTSPERQPKAPRADGDKPPVIEPAAKAAKADKPKKEKAPAVEDKPFTEFITQDFLPNLQKTLSNMGIQNADLKFEKKKLPIQGMDDVGECWQIMGQLSSHRQFIIGFLKEDINGQKFFSYADNGAKFSTLESFMIDERKATLDLLVLYTIQRLNGQKWLVRN
jgi:Protein of unknown function (DUF2996)